MAVAHSQAILCMTSARKSSVSQRRESPPTRIQSADPSLDSNKIVLQPRLCTLRTYGPGSTTRDVLIREDPSSPFFASLADYVANSRKSQDFEIISGRLAMLVFAGALGVELVTGDSLFKKVDVKEIAEAVGVCLAVVGCSAAFAWVSIERTNIGRILSLGCNSFVDSLVDNLVDGLFFDNDPNDWSDDM